MANEILLQVSEGKITRALNASPNASVKLTEAGANILDLLGGPRVDPESITKAAMMLKLNFGVEQSDEKMMLLFTAIRDAGWTEERFQATFKWFLQNKPYPAWTIADWFQWEVKVYPMSWFDKMVQQGYKINDFAIYRTTGGRYVCRLDDGSELPWKRLKWVGAKWEVCTECENAYDSERQESACHSGAHFPLDRSDIYPPVLR